ncbi:MAG TPA: hypothetical protein VI729_13285, partial [Anaerolineales bacterium]|nr:hypothetical protein [Anaerolineales bacterium]
PEPLLGSGSYLTRFHRDLETNGRLPNRCASRWVEYVQSRAPGGERELSVAGDHHHGYGRHRLPYS